MLGVRGMHDRLAGIMSSRHVSLGVNSQKEKREGGWENRKRAGHCRPEKRTPPVP